MYNPSSVDISGMKIYGGYDVSFGGRKVKNPDAAYRTELVNAKGPVTVSIKDFKDVLIDGVYISNAGPADLANNYNCSNTSIYAEDGELTLLNSVISGNAAGRHPCGLVAGTGVKLIAGGNFIMGGGDSQSRSSIGAVLAGVSGKLDGNVIIAGYARHIIGVRLIGADVLISHNKIDAFSCSGTAKTAKAVEFDGPYLQILDNVIYTGSSADQVALVCSGSGPATGKIKGNVITTFPQSGTNAVLLDCDGNFTLTTDFIQTEDIILPDVDASGNIPYEGDVAGLPEVAGGNE
jgi:hypothetical protein